ncbi:glycosyl hydrolase [Cohnella fermenti]|uniref:Glycosyl hydrolases family 2 sugar binding domain-containing protein n=1 Tax=Cohnella fermenti TaxID=2565925 RepID=A0A4S4BSC7_9BACL|nr:glycosyl hydrolase [Cohnella fermenti]THF77769.1 hypothetical protein E6C55_15635 [Cohnella fermenti]
MKTYDRLRKQFEQPPAEFSPIPFWFWNDALSREELIRQIHDFHAKEVHGFVLHPRMGLPRSMPYLSEAYLELVEAAVAEADKLGMRVILYDEGMYPSGSACGMVVRQNPDFASLGLEMREIASGPGLGQGHGAEKAATNQEEAARVDTAIVPFSLQAGEKAVSALAVRKRSDTEIEAGSAIRLAVAENAVRFEPPEDGDWSVLLFVETPSRGTIRGVHPGQDDGEPDAPLAADLLNPEAVQAFIALTHEKYYNKLKRYFGTTVFAMFTDEPDLLGRGHKQRLKPWTSGFLDEFLAGGGRETDLAALWFDAGEATGRIRDGYEAAIRKRLARTYYKPLADWCEAHGIALTGHPAVSNDIGLLEHFHIPGQDVVWRYIAPEEGKAIDGVHSTMGKCSSDAARHRGRRRNLNECFGVCGVEGGWALSADNMKWYLDWLFVRGVNLISPHAFYYSIRDERRDERPPDVGPNNIWWPEYARFSRYIKRMSWLMTDSANTAKVAVLAGAEYLPWNAVKPLYEHQIEFNYLEEELLRSSYRLVDGTIRIAEQAYTVVLIEDGARLEADTWRLLEAFVQQGGVVLDASPDERSAMEVGQRCVSLSDISQAVLNALGREAQLQPAQPSIRISCVVKDGVTFHVIVNEGEERYEGKLRAAQAGYAERWDPWTGAIEAARAIPVAEGGTSIEFGIDRRECVVIAIDPSREAEPIETSADRGVELADLSDNWQVQGEHVNGEVRTLASWMEWDGMRCFSGTVVYEKGFGLPDSGSYCDSDSPQEPTVTLDLGDAHELVRVFVNDREIGVRMWKPYTFTIGRELLRESNKLRVEVTNSLSNRYDRRSLPSGLLGPVTMQTISKHSSKE